MHVFKHPKYYEEFRQRAKRAQKKLRERNISDQVISKESSTEENQRAPGLGLKLPDSTMVKQRASSSTSRGQEQQATSAKPQAPSESSNKPQASSPKQQASSSKPQASSSKILEPR
jgi:hypothetical protein